MVNITLKTKISNDENIIFIIFITLITFNESNFIIIQVLKNKNTKSAIIKTNISHTFVRYVLQK